MAVTKIDDWEYTSTNSANTLTLSTVSAGTSRLIVCFVTSEAADPVATAISIGGQSGEQISGSPIFAGSGTTQQTVSGWIIKEAAIAAKSNNIITITFTTQPTTVSITAAVFDGVDQTTPIGEYQEDYTDTADPNPITTVDITVDSVDNYVVACGGMGNDGTAAWAAPLTERTEVSMATTATSSVGDLDPSGTGNTTVELTWTTPNRSAIMSIEIQTIQGAYKLEGVTNDKTGSTLGTCKCFLFKDNQDNTLTYVTYDESDGSGNYSFTGISDNDAQYLVVAWKDNTPHVFDVTDHVLQPVAE